MYKRIFSTKSKIETKKCVLAIKLSRENMVAPVVDLLYFYGWDFDSRYNRNSGNISYGEYGGYLYLCYDEYGNKIVYISGNSSEDPYGNKIEKFVEDVDLFNFKIGDKIILENNFAEVIDVLYCANIVKIKTNIGEIKYTDLNGNLIEPIESNVLKNI